MADTSRPAAIVTDKFRVKVGATTVTMGISPKTGTLCVYAYEDAHGYHSLGRWPIAKYASQWKSLNAVAPAVASFIAADERKPEAERQLTYKAPATKVNTGETIEFDATDSLVQMLVGQGMTQEEAETLAAAAS